MRDFGPNNILILCSMLSGNNFKKSIVLVQVRLKLMKSNVNYGSLVNFHGPPDKLDDWAAFHQ